MARPIRTAGGKPLEKSITAYPFYWFSILEQAIEKRNFRKALHAQDQLERLGFKVSFVQSAEGRRVAQ